MAAQRAAKGRPLPPTVPVAPNPDTIADALEHRLRKEPGELLRNRSATVVLDAGENGSWVVELRRGRPLAWHAGKSRRADAVIRASIEVLIGLVNGTVSGVEAFLAGWMWSRAGTSASCSRSTASSCTKNARPTWARTRMVTSVVGRHRIATGDDRRRQL